MQAGGIEPDTLDRHLRTTQRCGCDQEGRRRRIARDGCLEAFVLEPSDPDAESLAPDGRAERAERSLRVVARCGRFDHERLSRRPCPGEEQSPLHLCGGNVHAMFDPAQPRTQ